MPPTRTIAEEKKGSPLQCATYNAQNFIPVPASPSEDQDADARLYVPETNRFILWKWISVDQKKFPVQFIDSSIKSANQAGHREPPTLLADAISEGFNACVLISFTESPCPTKLCT